MTAIALTVAGLVLAAATAVIACLQLARTPRQPAAVAGGQPVAAPNAAGRSVSHNLPVKGPKVGRNSEMERVFAGIRSGYGVIALEGLGGMGKTTVALHCAWQLADCDAAEMAALVGHSFDAIIWIDDRSGAIRVNQILDTVAEVIDYPFIRSLGPDAKLTAVLEHLADHRCLLVLDGLDDLDDQEVLRFAGNAAATGSAVVVTSRRDHVSDAWKVEVGKLPSEQAATVMLDEARRVAAPIPEARDFAIDDIVTASGGNPLAIKLAVGRLRSGSPVEEIVRDLSEAAQTDLFGNIFDRNWTELAHDDGARNALMAIAVHDSECAVNSIAAAVGKPVDAVVEALERLRSACLVETTFDGIGIHRLTRAFVRRKMAGEPASSDWIERRLIDHYLNYAAEHADTYRSYENVQVLERERFNIIHFARLVCQRAQRDGDPTDWRRVLAYADTVGQLLWAGGYRVDHLEMSTWATRAAEALGDGRAAARHLCTTGRLRLWMDNTAGAAADLQRSKNVLPEEATDVDRACIARLEAQIASKAGDHQRAEELLTVLLATAPDSADDEGRSATLVELGLSAFNRGDIATAERRLTEALRLDEQFGTVQGRAVSLGHLTDVLYEQGKYTDSEKSYTLAQRLAEQCGRRSTVARCSLGLARIALVRRQYAAARQYAERSEQIFMRLGMVELTDEAQLVAAKAADGLRLASRVAYQLVAGCAAVVFDCDDTIVATAKSRWAILIRTAASFGVDLDEATIRRAWGLPFDQLIAAIVPGVPLDRFVQLYRRNMAEKQPRLTPGAQELIDQLGRQKAMLVILTSSSRELIVQDLDALGLTERFDQIYGYEQSPYYKPDPRVLDESLRYLAGRRVERDRIVYLGDSLRDYQAARQRKVQFLAVLTGLNVRSDFVDAGLADQYIVQDLTELLDPA